MIGSTTYFVWTKNQVLNWEMEMGQDMVARRAFLKGAASGVLGSAGLMVGLPAFGLDIDAAHVVHEVAEPEQDAAAKPQYTIKFAVCGMSHDHIYGMVGAIQRGGGVLVSAHGAEPDKKAAFAKKFPDVKMVSSEDEILNDPSIQLVLSSTIPNERADLGIRDGAYPQSGFASLVLRLDSAARRLATRLPVVRFLHHALRVFLVLE